MAISLCKWLLAAVLLFPGCELPGPFLLKHPFYVSVTEISHNAKDKTIEISCKLFTNDLEAALEKFTNTKIDLSAGTDKAKTDKFIATYINKHLQLKIDGRPVSLELLGTEKESEATWTYFQANNI